MSYESMFFAKVDNRVIMVAYYVSLVTVGKLYRGQFTETDIILYRYRNCCHLCNAGKYEMVRFSPVHNEVAHKFFPYGPAFDYSGSAWKETTDWLAPIATMTLPVRDNNSLRKVGALPADLPPYYRSVEVAANGYHF